MKASVFALSLTATFLLAFAEERIRLEVPKHQPCGQYSNAAIVFSNSQVAPIVPDSARGDGCYKMSGAVQINSPLKGRLYTYVESKNGTHADPVPCHKAHLDGCGGIGSCIYCDTCNTIAKDARNSVELLSDSKPLDCNHGLDVGTYRNVSLSFCAPTVDDFLKSQNIDRSAWDQVISKQGTTVYQTVRFYLDTPINTYTKSQLTDSINSGQGVVGCHKLVMNISGDKDANK